MIPWATKPLLLAATLIAFLGTATSTAAAEKATENAPLTITAGPDWLPLDVSLDIEPGSAIDFSSVVPHHSPAGKFGRVVTTKEGKFAFEKQASPARFYGVDLCCSAQYLPHERADLLADRLVRLGYNAVRIHHYERDLVERVTNEVQWKADKLDQLDYLFAAIKQRGIYVTTDLYVSRFVAIADVYDDAAPGSKNATKMADHTNNWTFENYYRVGPDYFGVQEFKMAVYINDRAFENYKTFARALLDHRNPYTKLRYADDPALGWLSLMNEDCPGNFIDTIKGRLRDEWQRAWNRWLAARYRDQEALTRALGNLAANQDPAKGTVPLPKVRGSQSGVVAVNVFLADVQRRFIERTRKFLRDEMHCQALLTDCNGWTNPVQMQGVRGQFDYVDDHFYVDHPTFLKGPRQPPSRLGNTSMIGATMGPRRCASTRLFGKPFTITEFNYCAPGQFRGVGGILTGAMAAVQDWDGLWRHVYTYNSENFVTPAAMYYFDLAADPLNLAAERAGLCLFLRGDLQPAKHAIAITSTSGGLLESAKTSCAKSPSWDGLAWLTRVGWMIDHVPRATDDVLPLAFSGNDTTPLAADMGSTVLDRFRQRQWLPAANSTDFTKKVFQSETGEITADSPQNIFTINTPRTAGGFAPAGKRIETGVATIEIQDTDATVWISSLDDQPIASSKRLLVTHLTDLQNTGTQFADSSRKLLLAWGQLPHLVRAGRATVTLRIANAGQAKVHALAVNGKRTGEVRGEAGDGRLSIPLSVAHDGKACMLYEVEIGR
jgi:hypothetical protein